MDYKFCTKDSEGRIFTQPNYVQIIVVILVGAFIVSMIWNTTITTWLLFTVALFLLGGFQIILSLWQGPISINSQTRTIEIGRNIRTIPFAEVDRIEFSGRGLMWKLVHGFRGNSIKIEVILKNGNPIFVGSMSGKNTYDPMHR